MLISVLGLVAVGLGLLGVAVVASTLLVASFVARPESTVVSNPWAFSLGAGGVLGGVCALGLAVRERRRTDSFVTRQFDAHEPTAEERGRLEPRVRRFAGHLDVPKPMVRVAETDVAHASVSGLSRHQTTLVVSRGVLSTLDGAELDAVLAHELAHVANRDAAVCTLVSIPSMVAHSILTYDPGVELPGQYRPVDFTLYDVVGGFFWLVGRPLVSVFARQREYAADEAAVAATGNPSALASALRKLSGRATSPPTKDLRAASAVGAFSIVRPPGVTPDPEYWAGEARPLLIRLEERVFATHPPMAKRLDRLADVADATA
jgi:heat shock protein HtpX